MFVVLALLVLSAIVVLHEFGHFIAARLCGVRVIQFGVGMGPILCSKVYRGTLYSLRLFPLGGFVELAGPPEALTNGVLRVLAIILKPVQKLIDWVGGLLSSVNEGEDEEAEEKPSKKPSKGGFRRNFKCFQIRRERRIKATLAALKYDAEQTPQSLHKNKHGLATAFIAAAGPLASAAGLYISLIALMVLYGGFYTPSLAIAEVKNDVAVQLLQKGDRIVSAHTYPVQSSSQLIVVIGLRRMVFGANEVAIGIERNGKRISKVIPFTDKGKLGVTLEPARFERSWRALRESIGDAHLMMQLSLEATGKLIKSGRLLEEARGPVGIIQLTGDTAKKSQEYGRTFSQRVRVVLFTLLYIGGILSISIGLTQLLPIFPFDGGLILYGLYRAVVRKEPPELALGILSVGGICFAILLFVVVTFKDVARLFT